MIRALIVDDELHAREEMEALLLETGLIEVVGTCGDAVDALNKINSLTPEVLFLDIQMPLINGFELLNMVHQDIMPQVVFVTAYDEYSLKAFEEKTLDYLLKPVDSKRLQITLDKLVHTLRSNSPPGYQVEMIKRIPCLIGNRIKLIGMASVEYISAGPAGVHVTTAEGEFYTEVTLKVLEERTRLSRCHKQYLANLDWIDEIVLLEGGLAEIITTSGRRLPVSRRYLKKLKKRIMP